LREVQTFAGSNYYRDCTSIYQVEDSSVLNFVYFEYLREEFLIVIAQLSNSLAEYIRIKLKSNSRSARLGFSSEKELINICAKIFETNLTIR